MYALRTLIVGSALFVGATSTLSAQAGTNSRDLRQDRKTR